MVFHLCVISSHSYTCTDRLIVQSYSSNINAFSWALIELDKACAF